MNAKPYARIFSLDKLAHLKLAAFYWLPVAVWASAIFVLSHATPSTLNETTEAPARMMPSFVSIPILAHLVEFGFLSIFVYRLVAVYQKDSILAPLSKSLLISSAYGLIDELHQSFVPGRDASVTDVGLDVLGTLTGLFLVWVWLRLIPNLKGGRTHRLL